MNLIFIYYYVSATVAQCQCVMIFLVYIHVYIWHIYCQNMEYHWQTKIKLNVVSKDALEYALPE